MAGFEPTNNGVKVHCLTTWRHPRKYAKSIICLNRYSFKIDCDIERGGSRTPDTKVRSPVL